MKQLKNSNKATVTPASKFRQELLKLMPGYKWTVHQSSTPDTYLKATGTQSSGMNRLSTLNVVKRVSDDELSYEVKSAGFGGNAPWEAEYGGETLARALRRLQDHYKGLALKYSILEQDLQAGRTIPKHELNKNTD